MPRAASSASLQAGIARLRKKWSLPPTKRSASATSAGSAPVVDHRRGQVAQQHQGAGAVAVVGLVAHLQHLGQDPGDVDRPGRAATARLQQRAEHVAHPAQPVEHLGAVGAVPQHLAEPLVERAVGTPPGGRVLEHEHPHRRRDHAGHRADGAAVVARLERPESPALEQRDGVLRVVDQPLERGGPHQRAPQRAGGAVPADRRPGVQELAGLEAEHLARPGATSTSVGAARRARRPAPGRWRRARSGSAATARGRPRCRASAGASRPGRPPRPGRLDRVGEQVGADGDDAVRGRRSSGASSELDGAAGGRGVGQVDLGAGLDQRPDLPVAGPAGRWAVPTTETTTGTSTRRRTAGASSGRRVGLGAVAEHHVEQHARRCAGSAATRAQLLQPQRRVDHRVGPARGELVVAEVGDAPGAPAVRRRSAAPPRTACRRRTARAAAPPGGPGARRRPVDRPALGHGAAEPPQDAPRRPRSGPAARVRAARARPAWPAPAAYSSISRGDLGGGRLGDERRPARPSASASSRRSASRVDSPPTSAERSRPPTPSACDDADPGVVEQREQLLAAGAGGGDHARPGRAGSRWRSRGRGRRRRRCRSRGPSPAARARRRPA